MFSKTDVFKFFVIVTYSWEVTPVSGNLGDVKEERFSRTRYLVATENLLDREGKISIPSKNTYFQWTLSASLDYSTTPESINLSREENDGLKTSATQNSIIRRRNRRRKNKNKRKRKDLSKRNSLDTNSIDDTGNISLNVTTIAKPIKHRRKHRRRRRRKNKKRKNKKQSNNILEISAGKNVTTLISSNSSLNELIQKLNENPEGNFENFIKREFNIAKPNMDVSTNKSIQKYHASGISSENLVYPIAIPLPDSINLHLNLNHNKTGKPYKLKGNRCYKNKGGCSHICNVRGNAKCSCLEGFGLDKDGKTCLDIDECAINNGGCAMDCKNTLGSFECQCAKGLRLTDDAKSCQDINECFLRNGHGPCDGICHNTYGSYTCSCTNGTTLGDDKRSCIDVDECAEGKSGCSHICINTRGNVFCSCHEGMELSSDWKTCEDINECEDDSIRNSCREGCINTEGSYRCVDLSELQNDQSFNAFSHVVCPPIFPPKQGFYNCSRDKALNAFTKGGRKMVVNSPGTVCKLSCPLGHRPSGRFHLKCGLDGVWIGNMGAKCIHSSRPVIKCPPSQKVSLEDEAITTFVKFPPPSADIAWKFIESHPKWAKNLKGVLHEGEHTIIFHAIDPKTKLESVCSFNIVVKR